MRTSAMSRRRSSWTNASFCAARQPIVGELADVAAEAASRVGVGRTRSRRVIDTGAKRPKSFALARPVPTLAGAGDCK